MRYAISAVAPRSFDETVLRITDELKKESFGILTTIDMQATLKAKLGADVPRYVILGACNPRFAHQALAAEAEIGLFLPCNVIVYEREDRVHLAAFDPEAMSALVRNPELAPLEADVRARLERAVAAAAAV